MKAVIALAALSYLVVFVAAVPTPHANPDDPIPDLNGSHPGGKTGGCGFSSASSSFGGSRAHKSTTSHGKRGKS
ncbi:hypothetical protein V8D89_010213 [Ganoderma adspersum]